MGWIMLVAIVGLQFWDWRSMEDVKVNYLTISFGKKNPTLFVSIYFYKALLFMIMRE